MQNVAQEMNLPETAFLNKQGDGFSLRWFTPTSEVDLEHTAIAAEAIARYVNSPRDEFLVRESARNMARFKLAKFEGIYDAYP